MNSRLLSYDHRPMSPIAGLAGIALIATVIGTLAPTFVLAQDLPTAADRPEINLVIEGSGRDRWRLAMPDLAGSVALLPDAQPAAADLDQTLRSNLASSGIFTVQGPAELAVLQLTGDELRDRELYRSLGNELVLRSTVTATEDKITLQSELIDLASGEMVLHKSYAGPYELSRRIAHTLSDDIILHFTGRRGIALTDIAFASDRSGHREIYLMDADGANQRAITAHNSISMSPNWSPQRDVISYVSYVNGRAPGLYLVDLVSGRKTELVTSGTLNISPSFSPRGDRVAFARSIGGGNSEIFAAARDGSSMQQLTRSPGIDTNPAWSPTGAKIAFTSSRSGSPQVYIMNTDGSGIERLSRTGAYNDGAAWSPDGTKIAYSSRRSGRFRIVVTDVVTKEEKVLTSGSGSDENPTFSPDGRKIAFASTGPWGTQIFIVSLDGTEVQQMTKSGRNWAPSWSGYLP